MPTRRSRSARNELIPGDLNHCLTHITLLPQPTLRGTGPLPFPWDSWWWTAGPRKASTTFRRPHPNVCMCVCTCLCARVRVFTHVFVCACVRVNLCVCVRVSLFVYGVFVYTCVCVCRYVQCFGEGAPHRHLPCPGGTPAKSRKRRPVHGRPVSSRVALGFGLGDDAKSAQARTVSPSLGLEPSDPGATPVLGTPCAGEEPPDVPVHRPDPRFSLPDGTPEPSPDQRSETRVSEVEIRVLRPWCPSPVLGRTVRLVRPVPW